MARYRFSVELSGHVVSEIEEVPVDGLSGELKEVTLQKALDDWTFNQIGTWYDEVGDDETE